MTGHREKIRQAFLQYAGFAAMATPAPWKGALTAHASAALCERADAYRPDPMGVAGVQPHRLVAPDYGVNVNRVAMPVDAAMAFRCGVPKLGSLLGVVANDAFHPTQNLLDNMPAGLTVCSLRNTPAALMPAVQGLMERSLDAGDAAVALNATLLADGVLIHAAAGIKVDKAIQIVNLANPVVPMLNPRRVVIIADEGADVRVLLCDHSQSATVEHLNLEAVDVLVGEHAHVELYDIEEGTAATRRLWQLTAWQQSHSHLTVNSTFLHGGRTLNRYNIHVEGDYADTRLSGLAICGTDQIVDNQVTLHHTGTHCTSRQLFKTAMYDNARGGFGGKIIVAPGAVFTDAEQTNRNLLIGEQARITAAPQLEIYCDEVKCSHGATTGRLDEQALFYMQTRGIPRDEARRMLTQAFMADVVDDVSFEVLRQRLHMLVERRLNGNDGCDTCGTSCKV